jgi:hypothetical protein
VKTRLTEFFGIEHPILSAPMALISGGRLAAAVTSSGGLGFIGGGYGDSDWLQRESGLAEGKRWDAASSPGAWPANPNCSIRRWSGNRSRRQSSSGGRHRRRYGCSS